MTSLSWIGSWDIFHRLSSVAVERRAPIPSPSTLIYTRQAPLNDLWHHFLGPIHRQHYVTHTPNKPFNFGTAWLGVFKGICCLMCARNTEKASSGSDMLCDRPWDSEAVYVNLAILFFSTSLSWLARIIKVFHMSICLFDLNPDIVNTECSSPETNWPALYTVCDLTLNRAHRGKEAWQRIADNTVHYNGLAAVYAQYMKCMCYKSLAVLADGHTWHQLKIYTCHEMSLYPLVSIAISLGRH